MKITRIEQAKRRKNRINVFIDGEFSFACMKSCIIDFDLHSGKELSKKQLEELIEKTAVSDARDYLFGIISRKAYSENEIRRKLKLRKTPDRYIEGLISQMRELGLLNDSRMRSDYADYLIQQNKFSKNEIILKLRQKMLYDDEDPALIKKLSEHNDSEVIKSILDKRMRKEKDFRKNVEYFLRRGFRYEDVLESVKEFKKE